MSSVDFDGDMPTFVNLRAEVVLGGRFRLVRKIGAGGMGEVWLAEDGTLDNRPVALKMLRPELAEDAAAIVNLKREVVITRELRHPHIVGVFDFHQQGELGFVSMEYVAGKPLSACLGVREGPFPLEEVLPWARQVADALDYAHGKKVLHRDVKPGNMLLADDGTVKLVDFGIARVIKDTETRRTGHATSGTLAYMSPQQVMNEKAHRNDSRNDVYSFAASLYELLSGEPPFAGGDLSLQILRKRPEPIEGVPEHVNTALLAGLAKEIERRPATCAALTHELSGAAAEARRKKETTRRAREEEQRKRAEDGRKRSKAGPRAAWAMLAIEAVFVALILVVRYSDNGTAPNAGNDTRPTPAAPGQSESVQPPSVTQPALPPQVTVTTGQPKPGDVQTVDLGGGVTLELVWCPPGTFTMGSPESEAERIDDETQHQVTLTQGFWMGKYEVTQAQWEAVMGNNPSGFKSDPRLPVEAVSWEDCQEFLDKLNGRVSGGGFRLPTEAQWEHACRAGTATPFHFGETISTEQANYNGNYTYGNGREGVYREKTVVVGSFSSNAWGLHDMHGNIWEWCSDWYDAEFYGKSTARDPENTAKSEFRALRGGSWYYNPGDCRSAGRSGGNPANRDVDWGFRVVRVPSRS